MWDEEGNVVARKLLLVQTSPVAGREDDYEKWYDEVHLRDIVDLPGVVSGQRYGMVEGVVPGAPAPDPAAVKSYLTIYELDGDPSAIFAEMMARIGDGRMALSDSLDMARTVMTLWSPHGDRIG
jgi:hypothetical protein